MLRLRSLFFDFCLYGLMLVMGVLFAPMAIWSAEGAYRACQIYARSALWLLRAICGLDSETRGPIPQGEVIVASKHQSFLDILILVRALPRARFIMKQELRWAPILGLYAMRMGSTPVNRGARSKAMRDMVAHAGQTGEAASQLVIYPQGTRVLPGATLPYKMGAGVLYDRMGKPCVPAATNVGVFWARRSPYRKPGLAVVEFLPEIPPGLPIPAFMAQLETLVETESNRLMREAGFDPGPDPAAAGAGGTKAGEAKVGEAKVGEAKAGEAEAAS